MSWWKEAACLVCPVELNKHARKVDNTGPQNMKTCFGIDVASEKVWLCSGCRRNFGRHKRSGGVKSYVSKRTTPIAPNSLATSSKSHSEAASARRRRKEREAAIRNKRNRVPSSPSSQLGSGGHGPELKMMVPMSIPGLGLLTGSGLQGLNAFTNPAALNTLTMLNALTSMPSIGHSMHGLGPCSCPPFAPLLNNTNLMMNTNIVLPQGFLTPLNLAGAALNATYLDASKQLAQSLPLPPFPGSLSMPGLSSLSVSNPSLGLSSGVQGPGFVALSKDFAGLVGSTQPLYAPSNGSTNNSSTVSMSSLGQSRPATPDSTSSNSSSSSGNNAMNLSLEAGARSPPRSSEQSTSTTTAQGSPLAMAMSRLSTQTSNVSMMSLEPPQGSAGSNQPMPSESHLSYTSHGAKKIPITIVM